MQTFKKKCENLNIWTPFYSLSAIFCYNFANRELRRKFLKILSVMLIPLQEKFFYLRWFRKILQAESKAQEAGRYQVSVQRCLSPERCRLSRLHCVHLSLVHWCSDFRAFFDVSSLLKFECFFRAFIYVLDIIIIGLGYEAGNFSTGILKYCSLNWTQIFQKVFRFDPVIMSVLASENLAPVIQKS